jgi:hypothetical protein
MKYLIIKCNVTYYHNKWGGLMERVFASIPKVKGSNLMNGVVCGQQWCVDQIFSCRIPRIGASVEYVAYLPRLGF